MASVYVEPWTAPAVSHEDIEADLAHMREGEKQQGNKYWNSPERRQRRAALEAQNKAIVANHPYAQYHEVIELAESPVLESAKVARDAQQEAKRHGEDYAVGQSTTEDLITMLRAIGIYGQDVAEKFDLNPRKLTSSTRQLDAVLGNKLRTGSSQEKSVDASTYMITALALARMTEIAGDVAEQTAAGWALDSLKEQAEISEDIDIITHPEHLRRVKLARTFGPWAADLAANAVVKHHLAAK